MENWWQGIALVLLAVFLEAIVDVIMDRWKITRRHRNDDDDTRSHH